MLRKRPRRRELAPGQAADAAAAATAAVVLLSRRDFCAAELREKLAAQGFEAGTVQGVVDEFIARGYLNDERYGRQFVAYHAERGHGPLRIQRDLAQRGLDAALIEEALAEAEDWAQRARELRIRRFGLAVPERWPDKAKQARFLQYRGFSNDHIRSALGSELAADLDEP
jgi:regulatory protein